MPPYRSYRLAVLVVTESISRRDNFVVTGTSEPVIADSEFVDYVELLSAFNFPYDIIKPQDVETNAFVSEDRVKYVVTIITCPFSHLSDSAISTIKEVSSNIGISVIASYSHVDERSKALFGIRSFRGKDFLRPLKLRLLRWPGGSTTQKIVVDFGLASGLSGYRKRGLGKLSVKETLTKALSLARSLFLPFMRVHLDNHTQILASTMDGKPLVWSYQYGKATNYYFALHGDLFLDKFNEMHRLVRSSIETNSGFGMVSVGLENTMALRLDDPGSCTADYLESAILEEEDWEKLGNLLESKKIPLSVMYTPAWVDDGDMEAGALFLNEKEVFERTPGTLYDSAKVRYVKPSRDSIAYDHSSEYKGLKNLVQGRRVDVQSHGLTHLDPDHQSWASARDKYLDSAWYHEFFHVSSGKEVPAGKQLKAMTSSREKIKSLFGSAPCVITPSGHRHGPETDLLAHHARYSLFSADYTGVLKEASVVRNWKIPSVFLYLKAPSVSAASSGYPIVGVIHDYEIKRYGLNLLEKIVEKWRAHGVRTFVSMLDLAASLCISLEAWCVKSDSQLNLVITIRSHRKKDAAVPEFVGGSVVLHLFSPAKMMLSPDLAICSGVTLLSTHQSSRKDRARLVIGLDEHTISRISMPVLRSVAI